MPGTGAHGHGHGFWPRVSAPGLAGQKQDRAEEEDWAWTLKQGLLVPGGIVGCSVTLTSSGIWQAGPAAPAVEILDGNRAAGSPRHPLPSGRRGNRPLTLCSPSEPGMRGCAEHDPRRVVVRASAAASGSLSRFRTHGSLVCGVLLRGCQRGPNVC